MAELVRDSYYGRKNYCFLENLTRRFIRPGDGIFLSKSLDELKSHEGERE